MFVSEGSYQGLMDLNAELWVLAKHREAFAERSRFWVIYDHPVNRQRLGAGITLQAAWINAYHNIEGITHARSSNHS